MWKSCLVEAICVLTMVLLVYFQLLENHIKNEVIENSQLVCSLLHVEGNKVALSEPRKSASIACGATVFEVCMKVPAWASQVITTAHSLSLPSLLFFALALSFVRCFICLNIKFMMITSPFVCVYNC